jgi:hypothetical protein
MGSMASRPAQRAEEANVSNKYRLYDHIAETMEELELASTPNGIRQLFMRNWRHCHPVVNAVRQIAMAHGLSGEDLYTVMAFELLRRLEILEDANLEFAMKNPNPPIIMEWK